MIHGAPALNNRSLQMVGQTMAPTTTFCRWWLLAGAPEAVVGDLLTLSGVSKQCFCNALPRLQLRRRRFESRRVLWLVTWGALETTLQGLSSLQVR